ncbi:hypothetical protein JZ751_028668 [Albula glossodonta]|uniref:Uncharacterized protein n=1 Tax=Albula glossodonta TaxID=121402 RepID=A0A8T2NM48_9TELE|nr:hypothetical protein JZ751_028668 [Albula glossodonta]
MKLEPQWRADLTHRVQLFEFELMDSEDDVGPTDPASLVLESDFLLGQDLQFGDNDTEHKILDPERDTEGGSGASSEP